MNKEQREQILESIKDIKMEKGAILSKSYIVDSKEEIKTFSDDDLLLKMNLIIGEIGLFLTNPLDVFKVYGVVVAHYMMEEEAQDRELYW